MPENQKSEYDASQIKKITPHEHVRLRPKMYIGSVDVDGLHQLLYEILYEAIDRAFIGECNVIKITFLPDKWIELEEYSQPYRDGSWLEHITKAFAGAPRIPYYCHELAGTSAILCSEMTFEMRRDNILWRKTYKKGVSDAPVKQIRALEKDEKTGMVYRFQPDFTIMDNNNFDYDRIRQHCLSFAYLLPFTSFYITDKRDDSVCTEIIHKPRGFFDWRDDIIQAQNLQPVHEPMYIEHEIQLEIPEYLREYFSEHNPVVRYQMLVQYCEGKGQHITQSGNVWIDTTGGAHVDGLLSGLNQSLSQELTDNFALYARIHVLDPDLQFESPSEPAILNEDIYDTVQKQVIVTIENRHDIVKALHRSTRGII